MNNKNILVTGASGQLGSEIKELSVGYPYKFFFTDKNQLDITNFNDVKNFLTQNSIDAIINCAAYTAVDKAESEPEIADLINHLAVKNLAALSLNFGIKLIHISTDYVFDGKNYKPYIETDEPNPASIYGISKLNAESEILKLNLKNSAIIRTSWVYGFYGKNFVKTILRLAKERSELNVVCDQVGTPTYAKDLARAILEKLLKISNEKTEIYHYSNEGVLSWYDFAKEIVKMAKIDCKINPIPSYEYPTPAARPHFSVLDKSKFKRDFGIEVPYWKDGLNECLTRLGERK